MTECPDCGNSNDESLTLHGSSKKYSHYTCENCGKSFQYSSVLGYND